jgi:hypothetical protein
VAKRKGRSSYSYFSSLPDSDQNAFVIQAFTDGIVWQLASSDVDGTLFFQATGTLRAGPLVAERHLTLTCACFNVVWFTARLRLKDGPEVRKARDLLYLYGIPK